MVDGFTSERMFLENQVFQGTAWGPCLWNCFYSDASKAVQDLGFTDVVYADDFNSFKFYARAVPNHEIYQDLRACQHNFTVGELGIK